MKLEDCIKIRQIKTYDEIKEIVLLFRDSFSENFRDSMDWCSYVKKIFKNGVCFACYDNNLVLGYITGYANDFSTKCGYGSLFAVSSNAGLLRGIIWKELLMAKLLYSKEQGMEYEVGEVHDNNIHAMNQYKAVGFKPIGRASNSSEYIKGNINFMLQILNSNGKGR